MKAQNHSISPHDLLFGIFCFMQGTILRSGYVMSLTRQDSWAMVISGFLLALPMLLIYSTLLKRFPGKSLIEIDDLVFGPVLGKVISALYLFYFITLCALNTRDLGNFVVGFIMPETPIAVIMLIFLGACVYTIYKGMNNLMYLSAVLAIMALGSLAFNFLIILKDVKLDFLLPLFRLEPMKYVQASVSIAAVPLGEAVAFIMVTPLLRKDNKVGKFLLLGVLLSAVSMLTVILRDIITLGPLISIVSLPSFESVRYASLAGVLTRMESLYAVVLVLLLLFKVCVLIYAAVLGLSQLFAPKQAGGVCLSGESHLQKQEQNVFGNGGPPLLLVMVAIVFFYSLFVFESVMDNMQWGATVAPFFSLTFDLLLPGISLIVAALRKKRIPQEAKA